jgi:hypothetical protein
MAQHGASIGMCDFSGLEPYYVKRLALNYRTKKRRKRQLETCTWTRDEGGVMPEWAHKELADTPTAREHQAHLLHSQRQRAERKASDKPAADRTPAEHVLWAQSRAANPYEGMCGEQPGKDVREILRANLTPADRWILGQYWYLDDRDDEPPSCST